MFHLVAALPVLFAYDVATSDPATIMAEQQYVLAMAADEADGVIEITVTAASAKPVGVIYTLTVEGDSTTRHSGSTRITGAAPSVISRVNIRSEGNWCATLNVEQDNGATYTLSEGPCA
ncbi:MAG: curli-like amyloid fiber formation chaperone CsgH [Pontixanthobacter sp.]